MGTEERYVTIRMIEDFIIPYYQQTLQRPTLLEVLQMMNEEGLLSSRPLPVPRLDRQQPGPAFTEAFDNIPYNVSPILENGEIEGTAVFNEERAAFPPGQDVFCRKVIPYLSDEPRNRSYFEIYYVIRGECLLKLGQTRRTLLPGDVCIVPPDTTHAVSADENSKVAFIIVRASTFDARFGGLLTRTGVLSGFFRESLYGREQPNYLLIHTPPLDPGMVFFIKNMVAECFTPDNQTGSCMISWTTLFLAQTLRCGGSDLEVFRPPAVGTTRADCGEILQYIQQNYRTVRLSSLAKQFHYNETYLSRMLQNFAHKSYTDIVRDIRMKRAEDYLVNSSLRVHEIASLVGYSSVDHFSRAFRTAHGMSPQAYRHGHGGTDE